MRLMENMRQQEVKDRSQDKSTYLQSTSKAFDLKLL